MVEKIMNTYTLDLITCVTGLTLWVGIFVYFTIRISLVKKSLQTQAKIAEKSCTLPKLSSRYVVAVVVSFVLAVLPYLVLFKLYITIVLEGCAVLGLFMLMRDRLQEFASSPLDKD